VDVFYDHLTKEQQRIISIIKRNIAMIPLTEEEQNRYDQAQSCMRCNAKFSNENPTVRHHNHHTGKFVDAFYNCCNFQVKDRAMVPVVFHIQKKITMRITLSDRSLNVSRRNTTKGDVNLSRRLNLLL
jgi:hypothetical protein